MDDSGEYLIMEGIIFLNVCSDGIS